MNEVDTVTGERQTAIVAAGMATQTNKLVTELQEQLGLGPIDAHRSAFVALAYRRGWTKARIGRYLGITRARVEQKIERFKRHAETGEMPTLSKVMRGANGREPQGKDMRIGFSSDRWNDLTFAAEMLNRVEK